MNAFSPSFSASRKVRLMYLDDRNHANTLTVPDNDELAQRANLLLVRMCGVTPPASLVNPILDAIFDAIQNSPVCMQNQVSKSRC